MPIVINASLTSGIGITSDNSGAIQFQSAGANTATITAAGEVRIATDTDQGAYNLQCGGTGVWAAGAYVNGSDVRLKDDIQPIGSCLNIIQNLNPVTFRYKPDWSNDQSIQTGFLAQELQQALAGQIYLNGVVQQGPEYMNVAYQALIPVLTKALQEANAKIDALEARIEVLEAK